MNAGRGSERFEALKARVRYLTAALPAGRLLNVGQIVGCLSGWATETFNTVVGVPVDQQEVAAVTACYRGYHWPASWWLPDTLTDVQIAWLVEHDWQPTERLLMMQREMDTLPVLSSAALRTLTVTSREEGERFGETMAAIFAAEAPVEAAEVRDVYATLSPQAYSASKWQLWLGYEGHAAVATASLFFHDDIACLHDLAIHPAYRRRGIGTAMFETALQRARQQGARRCLLQAAASTQPLYARQAFKAHEALTVWTLGEHPRR